MTATRDVTRIARSPSRILKRAAQFAAQLYASTSGPAGLTQRQHTVLQSVDLNDGISQTAMVKLTGIDRSTLADLVARLMAQGLLQRRRSREDGRTNALRVTALGKKVLKTAQPGAEDVDKLLMAKVPPLHRRSFLEALNVLAEEMDKAEAGDILPRVRLKRAG